MQQLFGDCFDFPWEWGSPSWVQVLRGHCHWKMTCKPVLSSHVWLSAHRRLGKLSSLEEEKASPESVFSVLSILHQVFGFSDVRPPGLLRGPQFPSQGHVSPCTLWASQKTFLGHIFTAHEEAGFGRVSEGAGCHSVVSGSKSPCTSNVFPVRNCRPPPCSWIPKRGC